MIGTLLIIISIIYNCQVTPASEEKGRHVQLQWEIKDDKLIFKCKVKDPFLPILIYKGNIEEARCVPLPEPVCNNNIPLRSASFIKLTNETIYTIIKFKPATVNGEWSCSHGSGGKNPRDSQQVNVCDNCSHVYVEVLVIQLFICVFTIFIQQCIKMRKKIKGNNTNHGRKEICNGVRQMLNCHHYVNALECIRTRGPMKTVLCVTICGLLLVGYFVMLIVLVEMSCYRGNLAVIRAVCIGVGMLISTTLCLSWTAMEVGGIIKSSNNTTDENDSMSET